MRMKKMYSITQTTAATIQTLAKEQEMPESFALDNIIANYWRMMKKNTPQPTIYEKASTGRKPKDNNDPLENESFPQWIKRINNDKLTINDFSQKQLDELATEYNARKSKNK